jgi:hypothetical protein
MPRKKGCGYGSGRKRRHRRAMHGRGLFSWLKKAHDWVKNNKIISTVGSALSGLPVIGNVAGVVGSVADTLGYGRRRRSHRSIGGRRHRRQRGGFLGIAGH